MLFQNCGGSQVQFSNGVNSRLPMSENAFDLQSKNFKANTKLQDLDIVWTFDNSGSMQEEADNMELNFQRFANYLQSMFNVRVALINRTKSPAYNRNNVALPASLGLGNVEVNYFVDSYNAMLVAAASTCPILISEDDTFCLGVKNQSRYTRVVGSLESFFRPNSKKVFVFVTDDDSSGPLGRPQYDRFPLLAAASSGSVVSLVENVDFIKEATFRDRLKRAFGPESDYKVYGFVSFDRKTLSPCGYKEGKEYISLVNNSGGQAFNICEADWSEHFRKLTESITEFAQHEFTIAEPSQLKSVLSVSINGTTLPAASYSVKEGRLTVDQALLVGLGTYDVQVAFEQWRH